MKKNILSLTAIALITAVSMFTSCKKDDTTPPVVTLTGAASQTVSLQSTYTDPGATANDDKDGALTPTISGSVNVNLTGTYIITYSATDAAGNKGTATRTVMVQNDAFVLAGTYNVSEVINGVTTTYMQTVTASTTVNNKIEFNKFADYANNTSIYAMVTGTAINLPSQTGVSIGTNNGGSCDVSDHAFVSSNGATTSTGFTLTFTDQITNPSACIGSVSCVDTYTKQ